MEFCGEPLRCEPVNADGVQVSPAIAEPEIVSSLPNPERVPSRPHSDHQ
jgi:hypothetical protein